MSINKITFITENGKLFTRNIFSEEREIEARLEFMSIQIAECHQYQNYQMAVEMEIDNIERTAKVYKLYSSYVSDEQYSVLRNFETKEFSLSDLIFSVPPVEPEEPTDIELLRQFLETIPVGTITDLIFSQKEMIETMKRAN